MIVTTGNRWCRALVSVVVALILPGCYYMQAARGQLDVMNKREPIDELLAAEDTPEALAVRLELIQEARQFAVDDLYLPDNDSYRSYADIGRDYVVWNVFAAPEFSLEAKTWCFPVAGCVAYRGYFSEEAARDKAEQLRDDGYDVAVGGVPAYSTLGKFDDPVMNTMMRWDDTQLISTIFHELSHQVLYVKDDSEFNESFATAVEEFGIERWLAERDEDGAFEVYVEQRELRDRVSEIIKRAREDLEVLYASSMAEHEMHTGKQRRLRRLRRELEEELVRAGRAAPTWLDDDLNNARLASMGLYRNRVPEFRTVYEECERDLQCFYDKASSMLPAESSTAR